MVPSDDDALERTFAPIPPAPIAGALAPSPYNFYFSGEDSLRLTAFSSVVGAGVAVNYRMQRGLSTHASRYTFNPANDRLASATEFTIGEGYLLNVTLHATQPLGRLGSLFVQLSVIRGRGASATLLGTIAQGYVTASQHLAWPGSPIAESIAGAGIVRNIVGTTPAGDYGEISETVPTGARWQLMAFLVHLTTVGGTLERKAILATTGNLNGMTAAPNVVPVPADAAQWLMWAQGVTWGDTMGALYQSSPMPIGPFLLAGERIYTLTMHMQPGDRYGQPIYTVMEWLEAQ